MKYLAIAKIGKKRVSQNVKEILSARFVGMKSVSPGIQGLDDESSWK